MKMCRILHCKLNTKLQLKSIQIILIIIQRQKREKMFKLTFWNYTCVMAGPTSPLFSLLCVVGSCMCAVNDAKCSLMRTADAKRFEDDRGDSAALWLFIKSYWLWTVVWTQTAQASKTVWNQRGVWGGGYDWNMKDEKSEQWAKQRESATCSWTVICLCLICQFSPLAVSHHWCYLCSLKTLLISLSPKMLCNMNAKTYCKWYLQIIIDYWQSQHFTEWK